VLPPTCDEVMLARAGARLSPVKKDGKRGYADAKGALVLEAKSGLIDKTGKVVVKPKYDYLMDCIAAK